MAGAPHEPLPRVGASEPVNALAIIVLFPCVALSSRG